MKFVKETTVSVDEKTLEERYAVLRSKSVDGSKLPTNTTLHLFELHKRRSGPLKAEKARPEPSVVGDTVETVLWNANRHRAREESHSEAMKGIWRQLTPTKPTKLH